MRVRRTGADRYVRISDCLARCRAFALEAFFTELSRRASALDGDERANLDARIQTARELAGGQDAVDRFLEWKLPSTSDEGDEDVVADETGEGPDYEDD